MLENKFVFINFDKTWKYSVYKLSDKEKEIFTKGTKFYYDEETTVRELLLFFNKEFNNLNHQQNEIEYKKINNDSSLKYLYRLVYKNDLIFIFDLRMKIKNLVKIINSTNLTFLLTIFIEKGGTVFNTKGMRFIIHSKENGKHHLPHIHVIYNEFEVVISLDGHVLEGTLPKKKLKIAKEIIEDNKQSLLLEWNNLSDGGKFELINNELVRVFYILK